MSDTENKQAGRTVKKEPKFCKCRLCHEYFYAETITEASRSCHTHWKEQHPEWHEPVCYCPEY